MPSIVNTTVSLGNLMPEQRDAMQKLLDSQTFASSPRLREVLSHLVAQLENGTGEQVSEQSIGHEVFGKPAGYNASEDNIVRVTIRHLRTRLEEYYQDEGKNEVWFITIPKGKYVPLLASPDRSVSLSKEVGPQATTVPKVAFESHPSDEKPTKKAFPLQWVAILLLLLVGAAGGYLVRAVWTHPTQVSNGVLGQLCHVGDDVSIVVVDSNLQAYRQIFQRQVTLDEYIHRTYANEPLSSADTRLSGARQFALGANETNVSSAIIAAALRQGLDGRHITIKHPHDLSVREFQDQKSVILLGGPFINPWGQLFENRFNFRLLPAANAPASSWIHNLKPLPGEASDYVPHMDGNLNVNYVRIAILPNFENSGHVILMGATNADALEAAGSYLLSNEAIVELEAMFHVQSVASLPPLEFVLETRGLNSVPNSHHILSYRSVSVQNDR